MNGIGSPVNMTASTRPMSARSTINLTVLMPRAIHNHFLNDRVLGKYVIRDILQITKWFVKYRDKFSQIIAALLVSLVIYISV